VIVLHSHKILLFDVRASFSSTGSVLLISFLLVQVIDKFINKNKEGLDICVFAST